MKIEEKIQQEAQQFGNDSNNIPENLTDDSMCKVAVKNAFAAGAHYAVSELRRIVEHWFRYEGPFVFPEDEDTLKDLLKKIQ